MSQKVYDCAFIGASAFSAGACGENSVIIDRGAMPAREYGTGLRARAGGAYECVTGEGGEFKRMLLSRNALTRRGYSPAPCAPITARALINKRVECRFMSRVTNIDYDGRLYRLDIMFHGKRYTLHAERLVDTTDTFDTRALTGARAEIEFDRSINALILANGEARAEDIACVRGITFVNAALDDEIIMRFPAARGSVTQAREALMNFWENRPETLRRFKLATIASEFDSVPSSNGLNAGSYSWIPPARFLSPDEAFDAGALFKSGVMPEMEARRHTPQSAPKRLNSGRYDVIVVGLGTAGAIAACRAAQLGLSALGIESLGIPGGTATAGEITGAYFGIKGGYYQKLDARAAALKQMYTESGACSDGIFKALALENEMRALGVEICYDSAFCGAELDGNNITGVNWTDARGNHAARARYVIDCTADCDVCINAGCDMLGGQAFDGHFQPYSNVCRCYYKDEDSAHNLSVDDGVVNQYAPLEYAKAVMESASSPLHLWDDYSGSARYTGMAALTGLREGLRVRGEAVASFSDYCNQAPCPNVIFHGYSNLDNHAKDDAFESREYRDWITICNMWGYNIVIPAPMGALIPKGFDGLLVAGRGISVEHALATGLRMKDDAQKSGEAAAVIAWLSIKHACRAKDVPYDALRAALESTGCLCAIDARLCTRQVVDNGRFSELIAPAWYEDPYVILNRLSSQAPGFAMWSARLLKGERGKVLEALLTEALGEGDTPRAYNCALALALRGNAICEQTLLRMITDKRGGAPSNGWSRNNLYSVCAISAAGRLGLASAVKPLEAIISAPDYARDIVYKHDGSGYEFMKDERDIYFQLFTHSMAALSEIARARPELRRAIRETLVNHALKPDAACDVSLVTWQGKRLNARKSKENLVARLTGDEEVCYE